MRILVYGAGNIGRLYAAKLARSSQDVTMLARGERGARLCQDGIELEDGDSGKRSTTAVQIVERLEPSDAFDLVLVVLPRHRVAEALPVLAANRHTPNVMFFGNRAGGLDELMSALGRDRMLLGFPGAAAIAQDRGIRYVVMSAREQPTTIGELDGRKSPRLAATASAFEAAGFPVSVCPNMDAWLKTHVAEILPTVGALYMAGGDSERLASNEEALALMIGAIREGYRVLHANGVPTMPGNHRVFEWLPDALLVFLMRRMMGGQTTAIKLGHAVEARDEWKFLADELGVLTAHVDVPTPSLDILCAHIQAGPQSIPASRSSA